MQIAPPQLFKNTTQDSLEALRNALYKFSTYLLTPQNTPFQAKILFFLGKGPRPSLKDPLLVDPTHRPQPSLLDPHLRSPEFQPDLRLRGGGGPRTHRTPSGYAHMI